MRLESGVWGGNVELLNSLVYPVRQRYIIMLTVDRSAQAEPWLFSLLKAKAFSNVMRQGLKDQEKGSIGGKSTGVGSHGKQLL